MARKKTEEIVTNLANQPVEENVEDKVITEEPENDSTTEELSMVPEFADKVLKIHYSYPELYVDCFGGAYVPGTQPESATDAILCKNPYYKQ